MDAKTYEEKRQARIERLEERAERARSEGEARIEKAHGMASVIPFGQPILVGHCSEGRDRNYRAKIESNFRKGFEQLNFAEKLEARAQAAAENTAIFSDDPAATEKLEDKIDRLKKRQEMMKKANALVRKGDREGLAEMGFSEAKVNALFTPDFCGRLGYPDFELKNNGANIRRLKARLTHIEAQRADETTETEVNGIRVVDNVEDNRLQIFFPGKPGADTIAKLKSNGFHWTPSLKCWQAYRGWHPGQIAKEIQEAA